MTCSWFATPWSFAYAHAQLDGINQRLGGSAPPVFAPFHVLFACLLGSVVPVWALLWLFIAAELAFCVAQWLPVQHQADDCRDISKNRINNINDINRLYY